MPRRPPSAARHTISVRLTDAELGWLDRALGQRHQDVVEVTGQATRSGMLRLLVQEGMRGGGEPQLTERIYITRERPRSGVYVDVTDIETVAVAKIGEVLEQQVVDRDLRRWGVDVGE